MPFIFLFPILFFPSVLFANTDIDLTDQEKQEIYSLVKEVVEKKKIAGLSFAVVSKDEILYKDAIGFAENSKETPATTETVYAIGSITKLFTTSAIMLLQERGVLNIDDPIGKYIQNFGIKSRFPDAEQNFSIRNLLTHHSGLPSDYLKALLADEPMDLDTLVEKLRQEFQPLPSDNKATYSNVAFSLLGVLIERVSGMSYQDFISKEFLNPLGMKHTAFDRDAPHIQDRLSKGYKKKEELQPYRMREISAGSIFSNVEDMVRFMQMYLNNGHFEGKTYLKPESIEQMWTHQNGDIELDFDCKLGLTWRLGNQGQSDLVNSVPIRLHTGSTVLFCNILILAPEQGIGVIVSENTARMNSTTNGIGNEILKYVLERKFSKIDEPGYLPQKSKPVNQKDLDLLPGNYATQFGMINVKRKGRRLMASVIGRKFKLVPHEQRSFGLKFRLLGFIPIGIKALSEIRIQYQPTEDQEALVFLNKQGEQMFFGTKFEKSNVPDIWKERLGKYSISNLGDDVQILYDMELKMEKDILYMQFIPKLYESLPLRMPLRVVSNNEAIIEGFARWQGETVHFYEKDEQEKFRYTGYDFIKK